MGAVLPGPQSSLPLSISVFRADSPAYICECPDCNGETRSCVGQDCEGCGRAIYK